MYINRQRQLPHEDFSDPRLVSLPAPIRFLAVALRMMSDAVGRGPVVPHVIRSQAWPAPDSTGWWPELEEIEEYLLLLDEAGWLTLYDVDGQTLFQILARWPHVSREDEFHLPPPPTRSPRMPAQSLSGRFPGSGERAGAGASVGAGERAGAGVALSGNPIVRESNAFRLPPSSFCSIHIGGPPEQLSCRDCGTARNRHTRYLELRTARTQAHELDAVLRSSVLAVIETEMLALEQAAASALTGTPAHEPDRGPAPAPWDDGTEHPF